MSFLSFLSIIDWILFIISSVSVLYLTVFSFASFFSKKKNESVILEDFKKVLILIPAYKEDKVILDSVSSVLNQDYPRNLYDIVVISDQMKSDTIVSLKALNLNLLEVNFKNSSKAKALNFAFDNINQEYDFVIILDADNTVNSDFLNQICKSYNADNMAIQAHRVAKNNNTDTAVLDALSEEMNNSIFRKGHVALGLPSALIGSGMAIDFKWLKSNISKLVTAGEDKELEALLIKERVFITYLEDVLVYDEKTQKSKGFYNQRRRWLAAQFDILKKAMADIPFAIRSFNIAYIDKVFQWMLLPRVLLAGTIVIISSLWTIIQPHLSVKWWLLLFVLIFVLGIAVPKSLYNRKLLKALKNIPLLFILMGLNLFRLKGAGKKFIHTNKG